MVHGYPGGGWLGGVQSEGGVGWLVSMVRRFVLEGPCQVQDHYCTAVTTPEGDSSICWLIAE